MHVMRTQIDIVTAADGSFTGYSGTVNGRVLQIAFVDTDTADTIDLTVTTEDTSVPLLGRTNVASDFYNTIGLEAYTAGAGIVYYNGAEEDPVVNYPVVDSERIKLVVAQGGDTKTATLHIWYG